MVFVSVNHDLDLRAHACAIQIERQGVLPEHFRPKTGSSALNGAFPLRTGSFSPSPGRNPQRRDIFPAGICYVDCMEDERGLFDHVYEAAEAAAIAEAVAEAEMMTDSADASCLMAQP